MKLTGLNHPKLCLDFTPYSDYVDISNEEYEINWKNEEDEKDRGSISFTVTDAGRTPALKELDEKISAETLIILDLEKVIGEEFSSSNSYEIEISYGGEELELIDVSSTKFFVWRNPGHAVGTIKDEE